MPRPIAGLAIAAATVAIALPAAATSATTSSSTVSARAGHAIAATHSATHGDVKRRHRKCDKNYRGRCLKPNVSDYDCAGGSGNGPYYVKGPFRSVGNDHYRLDADHDGIACER